MGRYITTKSHDVHEDSLGNRFTRDYQKVVEIDTASDPFYITFLNCVGWMYNIRGNVALNVMASLMEQAEFNTGIVSLSPASRRRIKESVGISDSALSRALNVLVERKAIAKTQYPDKETGELRESKGEYIINPEMFWKGDLKKRTGMVISFRSIYGDEPQTVLDEWTTDSSVQEFSEE